MVRIMIRCSGTGYEVFTGIHLEDSQWNRASEFHAYTYCPWCGADHEWSAKDVRFSDEGKKNLLVSYGPDEADLLRLRMAALHLDPEELAGSEPVLLRELQRLSTMCESRGQCARDLDREFARDCADLASQDWRDYCLNAATLNMLSTLGSCSELHK